MNKFLSKVLGVAVCASSAAVAAPNQVVQLDSVKGKPSKVAVVDMAALVTSSEYFAQVQELRDQKQKDIQQLNEKLDRQLNDERKKLLQGGELNAVSSARAQNELSASMEMSRIQLKKDAADAELEINIAVAELKNKIKGFVAEYARENDIAAILDSSADNLIFAADSLNITGEIQQFIAEKFKQDKRKASLLASVTNADKSKAAASASKNA